MITFRFILAMTFMDLLLTAIVHLILVLLLDFEIPLIMYSLILFVIHEMLLIGWIFFSMPILNWIIGSKGDE